MSVKNISSAILGVGVDDTTIDLFESQYPVPTGVSYNSYVIRDEKIAILDTVDDRATDEWLANVTEALAGAIRISASSRYLSCPGYNLASSSGMTKEKST